MNLTCLSANPDNAKFSFAHVTKGERAVAPTKNPTKRADAQYEYNFKGWKIRGDETNTIIDFVNDDAAIVNANVENEAVYDEVVNEYNVFFYNGEEVYFKAKMDLSDTLNAPKPDPTKIGDTENEFVFQGWKVQGDADASAYKNFGGLKVEHFAEYMNNGLLVFNASFA